RRAQNGPSSSTVDRHISFSITVVVCWHWYVLSRSSQCQYGVAAVKGAKDRPGTVAVNPNVALAVAIEVNAGWRSSAKRIGADIAPNRRAINPALLIAERARKILATARAAIASVNRRAAGEERMSLGGTAVVPQGTEHRIGHRNYTGNNGTVLIRHKTVAK